MVSNKIVVSKAQAPGNSILFKQQQTYDYVDSFEGKIEDTHKKIKASDLASAFFSSAPPWVGQLMNLRNRIVSLFGLKTSSSTSYNTTSIEGLTFEPGQQLGLFKVYTKTDEEITLGENDKHLDFRISLLSLSPGADSSTRTIVLTTVVTFHNWLGRLYFIPVKRFHRLIVPIMLKGILMKLEKDIRKN